MRRTLSCVTRSLPLLAVLLLWAGPAGAAGAACDGLTVDHAWVPTAPPSVPVMAAYFKATNTGDAAVELTAVSSPQFERAHMHKTVVDDEGTARMQPVETVTIAPGETIAFKQGSYHVMLFHPTQALAAGDTVTLALHCGDPETSLTVTADVHKRMSMKMDMAHHGHMDHGDPNMAHGMNHGMDPGSMAHDMNHGDMHHHDG